MALSLAFRKNLKNGDSLMKHKIIIVTVFFILIGALYIGYKLNRYFLIRYPRVQVALVNRNDLFDDIEVTGIVNAEDAQNIYLSSTTKINTLLIKEGDPVKTGQILAVMDSDAKRLELTQCQSSITRIEQELNQKKLEEYATPGLKKTEAELKSEYLRKSILQKELRELTIIAPISGKISLLSLKTGETATPGTMFGQIINMNSLYVEAEVPAENALKIKPGDNAEIRVASISDPYSATVIQILPPVKKVDNTYSNPRIQFRIQPGTPIMPGTHVDVRVRIGRAKLTVTVPIEAIHEETISRKGDRNYFAIRPPYGKVRKFVYIIKDCSETLGLNREREKQWLIRDNIYQALKVYVKTGINNADRIEITEGLKPFEFVIASSDRALRNYSRVIVINRDEGYKQPISLGNGDLQ